MTNPIGTLNQSNPENVITAEKGSIFLRDGENFFLITNGASKRLSITKKAFATHYKNEIWYPTLKEETTRFSTPGPRQ